MKAAIVQRGQAILENNLAASSWAEAIILKTAPFQTALVLAAPLSMAPSTENQPPRTIAIMATIAINRAHAFTEEDRLFLEQLGVRLGPVLQNVLASEERDALMAINSQVVVATIMIDQHETSL